MADLQMMKGSEYTEKRLRKWLAEDHMVVLQVKRDEFRVMVKVAIGPVTNVAYISAQGKPLHNLHCFDEMFVDMAAYFGQDRFDMGVCVNDSFDLTRRTVRASTKPYDLTGYSEQVIAGKRKSDPAYYVGPLKAKFWFYDLPDSPMAYLTRRIDMAMIAQNFPEFTGIPETEVVVLDLEKYPDIEHAIDVAVNDVEQVYEAALAASHEGLMVKRYDYVWEPSRRPDSWMKMKPEEEIDGRIDSYTVGKGKYANMVGSLNCIAEDGTEFSISGMTDAERQEFTDNFDKYRGLWLTAEFMNRDSQGGLRHPRFKRLHAEKNL